MKFTTLGFLTFLLWAVFRFSFLVFFHAIWLEGIEQTEDYKSHLPGAESYYDARKREDIYLKKLGRTVNPNGYAPVLFVLSGGFLAVMRTQRLVGSILLDAIRSSPDATAEALRRAAKGNGP